MFSFFFQKRRQIRSLDQSFLRKIIEKDTQVLGRTILKTIGLKYLTYFACFQENCDYHFE